MRNKVKINERVKEKVQDNLAKDQCHHYWVIEVANGPKSQGVCRYCGERRDFLNAIPDVNPMKRNTHPLDLPEMPEVELDENSQS